MESTSGARRGLRAGDVLQDGLLAGLLGGVTIIAVFFVVDLLAGSPLRTPSTLYDLFFGDASEAGATVVPGHAAVWNAAHLLFWLALGFACSLLFQVAEAWPRVWYLVFVALTFGAVALLNAAGAFGVPGVGRHALWLGAALGSAVLAGTLGWRHRALLERLDEATGS